MLSGCIPPGFACTTIGYISVAHVALADPRPGIELQLCEGEGCEPGTVMTGEEHPLQLATPSDLVDPTGPAAPSDDPTVPTGPSSAEAGPISLTGDSSTGWSAGFLAGYPVLNYRLIDTTGAVIAEGEVDVDWVRVGGSEQCGGPAEAEIELPG